MQLDAAHIVPQTSNLRFEARHHMRLIRRQAVPAVRQLLDTLHNALRLFGLLGHRQHIDIRFQNHGTPLVDTRLILGGFHARQLAVERELLVHHHIPIGGQQLLTLVLAESLIGTARTVADKESRSRTPALDILTRLIRRLVLAPDAEKRGAIMIRHPNTQTSRNSFS